MRRHAAFLPILAFSALLVFVVAGCAGGGSDIPTAPSTLVATQGARWIINSDSSSEHFAKFLADDSTVLDLRRADAGGGGISDLRVRRADGDTTYLRLDSSGRPIFVEDPVGTKLWINDYLD